MLVLLFPTDTIKVKRRFPLPHILYIHCVLSLLQLIYYVFAVFGLMIFGGKSPLPESTSPSKENITTLYNR